jgi:hypothetical protein
VESPSWACRCSVYWARSRAAKIEVISLRKDSQTFKPRLGHKHDWCLPEHAFLFRRVQNSNVVFFSWKRFTFNCATKTPDNFC